MEIDRIVKFGVHKRKAGEMNHLAIRCRVTIRGCQPMDFSLGYYVDLYQWNIDKQCAYSYAPDAKAINAKIKEWRKSIDEIFARYELIEKRPPTNEEFKQLFNDVIGRRTDVAKVVDRAIADKDNVFKIFNVFVTEQGAKNTWTHSTFVKFQSLKNHLFAFDPNLKFSDLNETKMDKYLNYLQSLGFKNTTISKNLSFVRWFLRWANQNGYYQGDIHETFKPKFKGVSVDSKEIIYLSREELNLIRYYEFQPSEAALERVRDVFLFCCFTGLRYSDVAKLKKTDIKDGYFDVVTKKTVDALRIELNDVSRSILAKYKDVEIKDDLALPVISNEKMNDHLKMLGQVCGLTEPTRIVYFKGNERHEEIYPKWALLTTHVARRTFVISALQLGIPAEVIMRWTGHSDYASMKPYIKIVDELKEKSMSLFNKF